ncbi:PEP/pyruvate-binding domain-containing protein [Rathayibacter sp. VKM Ac-2926]|uniref:PEP/pyruvate-binding domain-containing protein n=1 Tax=Rathayibacter sp. VKM Ac-2926 TaxID=2929477 RepID=UPI001FB4433E|nr:PEP/pyruvate-binding domain-containing protein [Rathayibacter sp. VKM Ac-2926]MCJ1703468.1 PEP-utilizing enzyme [Rathayibacter sp. VKM Ac-2926]
MNEMTVVDLTDASSEACGGKAAALGALLRAGLPVPDGFVVPSAAHRALHTEPATRMEKLYQPVDLALSRMGDPPVAVRSSAENEDTAGASAAGQYESILAVRGADAVLSAISDCWDSASSARVTEYWAKTNASSAASESTMAVLVQRLIDADTSGVLFTPANRNGSTRIEASWGLGLVVVGGTVTPDSYEVAPNGTVRHTVGTKTTRMDRNEDIAGVSTRDVDSHHRAALTLDDETAAHLATLGDRVASVLGGPQDIEWAISDGQIWILQARPITASLPPIPRSARPDSRVLIGTPGAHGVASGQARVIRSPSEFGRIQPGEILICPHTDPAWTPLFTIAGGVVTQAGGALSHAAIVAREYGIPAVLGITDVTELITDGTRVTLDGTNGTLTIH